MKYESGEILQGIRNSQLVCKDCVHVLDDSELLRNTSKCKVFQQLKPVSVLCGGNCLEYQKRR